MCNYCRAGSWPGRYRQVLAVVWKVFAGVGCGLQGVGGGVVCRCHQVLAVVWSGSGDDLGGVGDDLRGVGYICIYIYIGARRLRLLRVSPPTPLLIRPHTYVRTYIHTHAHIYTYARTYIRTHAHIYTYVRTYLHTYLHTYIHTYIRNKQIKNNKKQ